MKVFVKTAIFSALFFSIQAFAKIAETTNEESNVILDSLAILLAILVLGSYMIFEGFKSYGIYLLSGLYILFRLFVWLRHIVYSIRQIPHKFNYMLLILDILACWLFWNEYQKLYVIPERAKKFSQITLTQPQTIAGIAMPTGTQLRTNVDLKRTKPEPNYFEFAKFPQPVIWHGIPIEKMYRQMTTENNKTIWASVSTMPTSMIAVGQWRCTTHYNGSGSYLEWKLISQPNGETVTIPHNQSAEPYVYLYSCRLESNQTALLPEFNVDLPAKEISRDDVKPYQDVNKGLWSVSLDENSEKISQKLQINIDDITIFSDSQRVVQEFVAQLNKQSAKNCGLPDHTSIVWKKSQPDVIQVADEAAKIPKQCWGKKLIPTTSKAIKSDFWQK